MTPNDQDRSADAVDSRICTSDHDPISDDRAAAVSALKEFLDFLAHAVARAWIERHATRERAGDSDRGDSPSEPVTENKIETRT